MTTTETVVTPWTQRSSLFQLIMADPVKVMLVTTILAIFYWVTKMSFSWKTRLVWEFWGSCSNWVFFVNWHIWIKSERFLNCSILYWYISTGKFHHENLLCPIKDYFIFGTMLMLFFKIYSHICRGLKLWKTGMTRLYPIIRFYHFDWQQHRDKSSAFLLNFLI